MAAVVTATVEGVPISGGLAVAAGMASGDFYTMAEMKTYVVPPRNPAAFDGRALLLLPDMTGVSNVQNRLLAGARALHARSFACRIAPPPSQITSVPDRSMLTHRDARIGSSSSADIDLSSRSA